MTTSTPATAAEAIDRLDPEKWAATSPLERLHLLEEVRENCGRYADELGVLFGEVVLDDADGGGPSERSVGSVVIVEVDEPVVGVGSLDF